MPEHLTELGDYYYLGEIEMAATPVTVAAPVQSPVSSTINWAAIMGPIASIAAYVGLHVNPETLVQVVIGIQAVVSLYVVVKNTFFSPAVVAPSAIGLEVVSSKGKRK